MLFSSLQHLRVECETWPNVPTQFRKYSNIDRYIVDPLHFTDEVMRKLDAKKFPYICDSYCACMTNDLGHFSIEKSTWDSKCPNRRGIYYLIKNELNVLITIASILKNTDINIFK